MALSLIRDDSRTSSQLLQLLLSQRHLLQNCQLQSIIYRTHLPVRDISFVFLQTNTEREDGTERD